MFIGGVEVNWAAAYSALFGAVAAGLSKTTLDAFNRWREGRATLVAIASEVHSVCTLLRQGGYRETLAADVRAMDAGSWTEGVVTVDASKNYFEVFSAMASGLRLLSPIEVRRIVSFYSHAKALLDGLRPETSLAHDGTTDEKQMHTRTLLALMDVVLMHGDRIADFPERWAKPVRFDMQSLV